MTNGAEEAEGVKMINSDELKNGVAIATLASVSILTATFLQKADFIVNYKGSWPEPFTPYMTAALLFLVSSGAYLIYEHSEKEAFFPNLLHGVFQFTFFIGLLMFFAAAVITLKIYLLP